MNEEPVSAATLVASVIKAYTAATENLMRTHFAHGGPWGTFTQKLVFLEEDPWIALEIGYLRLRGLSAHNPWKAQHR